MKIENALRNRVGSALIMVMVVSVLAMSAMLAIMGMHSSAMRTQSHLELRTELDSIRRSLLLTIDCPTTMAAITPCSETDGFIQVRARTGKILIDNQNTPTRMGKWSLRASCDSTNEELLLQASLLKHDRLISSEDPDSFSADPLNKQEMTWTKRPLFPKGAGPCPLGAAPPSTPPDHIVFATSSRFSGNLGGLTGADAICQNHANTAGLSGTFRAILSVGGQSAASRLSLTGSDVKDTRGQTIQSPATQLFSGSLLAPINRTESGGTASSSGNDVWTGTSISGATSSNRCAEWTSSSSSVRGHSGDYRRNNAQWVSEEDDNCAETKNIYCISQ